MESNLLRGLIPIGPNSYILEHIPCALSNLRFEWSLSLLPLDLRVWAVEKNWANEWGSRQVGVGNCRRLKIPKSKDWSGGCVMLWQSYLFDSLFLQCFCTFPSRSLFHSLTHWSHADWKVHTINLFPQDEEWSGVILSFHSLTSKVLEAKDDSRIVALNVSVRNQSLVVIVIWVEICMCECESG